MGLFDDVTVVLCRTRNPMNLGAAARALKNAGLSRWTLVDPHTIDLEAARPLAVHAEELLAGARVVSTLAEALEGCALSVATTVRRRHARPPLRPREAVAQLAAAGGPVALVFGDERNGLSAEEVEACDLVSAIPSDEGQPSWNLAQSVAVYAYELRMETLAGREAAPAGPGDEAGPGQLAALDRQLAALLAPMGWEPTRRRLSRTLLRARPTRREAQLWTALLLELSRRTRDDTPE